MTVAAVREASMRKMNDELVRFARSIPREKVSVVFRKFMLTGLRKVVRRTPVDTGHARANWQVSLDAPSTKVLEGSDSNGSATIKVGSDEIEKIGARIRSGEIPFPKAFISNSVPYILTLEEGGYPNPSKKELGASAAIYAGASSGLRRKSKSQRAQAERARPKTKGGYSLQAPNGMVAVTVEELRAQFPR